ANRMSSGVRFVCRLTARCWYQAMFLFRNCTISCGSKDFAVSPWPNAVPIAKRHATNPETRRRHLRLKYPGRIRQTDMYEDKISPCWVATLDWYFKHHKGSTGRGPLIRQSQIQHP